MKTRILLPILAIMIIAGTALRAQNSSREYLGLPGDNLNLYAVMKIFQESKTLEEFEKRLNDPDNKINNLDLNGDGYVDYITVNDYTRGNVHNIVLRDAINQNESQDVAVFTVKRYNNGQVKIQLTGDEALYGKDYIIEPNYSDEYAGATPNPGYVGNTTVIYTAPVIIADWPLISYIYAPGYIGWHSDWYWGYYPHWWNPWRPYYWDYYYGFHYHWFRDYNTHYRRCYAHFGNDWHNHYYVQNRVYSSYVTVNINNGHYRYTYQHPETRKDGEEAYYRHQESQGRRSTYSTITTNTSSTRTGERKIGDSETSRRTMSSVSTATSSRSNPEKSSNTISERRTSTTPAARSRYEAPAVRSESKSMSSERTVNRSTVSATRATAPVSSARRNDNWQPEKNNVSRERPVTSVSRSNESRPAQKSQSYSERKPATNSAGYSAATERRSSNESKTANAPARSENTTKKEENGSARRR